ncbi:type II secretion system F family protein [Paludibacterium sp. THUN1379]|uniref:type II secretion system F family protein n=1 Tax=Paludibacterium sp. THUN1379 TaxID=3112107 RepID=UPI003091FF15|nr:type II secretion system F family protein [Paludibacterium sp. THUN1379]
MLRQSSHAQQLGWVLRQLATLLQAGVPLSQALEILVQGPLSANMHQALQGVSYALSEGEALHRALQRFPRLFPARVCVAIMAAEAGGQLARTLMQLALEQEGRNRLAARVRQALFYPVLVMLTGLGVMLGVCLTVVPVFREHYLAAGRDLPLVTRGLLALTDALTSPLGALLPICAVLLVWLLRRRAWLGRSGLLARLADRLPLWGPLRREAALARWTRTLSLLLEAGVPLMVALPAASQAAGHHVLDHLSRTMLQLVSAGSSLHQTVAGMPWFPPILVQLLRVGEQSGALAGMCARAAEYFAAEVEQRVAVLTGLLEPFAMLLLGLMCAGLIWALYLPIFELGETVM